jgi:hypothetical protein
MVVLTDSEICSPMLVKKSLNSLAISVGSVSRVPFLLIFSTDCDGLLRLAASLRSYQILVFALFLIFQIKYHFYLDS